MSRRVLLYGDVNLNIIDGSAIWAQSMAESLSRVGCDVTVVLKARVKTDRLTAPIGALPGVRLVNPLEQGLVSDRSRESILPAEAAEVMRALDVEQRFDVVVMRGLKAVDTVVRQGHFDGRLWTYLTDIPQSVPELGPAEVERIRRISAASRYMLCQTEELRCFLEACAPEAAGRSVLWTPVVPDLEAPLPARAPLAGRPLELVYTGKFAPRWNTLEMTRLPARLAERGVDATLHMVGDKVHDDPHDPSFAGRMRAALESSPGVQWHGGMPRQAAMELSARADVGLSWRDPALDASLELSTKVLEFGSLGLAVVLNRTAMHERLYGVDYPLFVAGEDELVDALASLAQEPESYALAVERSAAVSQQYGMDVAVARMRDLMDRAFPVAPDLPALRDRTAPLKVVVAGHDLKFFTRMLDHLQALPELEVRVDQWAALSKHDVAASKELVEWADVVIAEWCGPVAIWYADHKRRGQRLIVRLHRFELYSPYPGKLDIDAVDQVVTVSPHYGRLTREITGWPAEKVVVIPNWVDVEQFDRPKLDGARFALGMIGIAPLRKRMDLGLDVLERLRGRDERYVLHAKTKMPWDYWWIWKQPDEQAHYDEVFRRIQVSPRLRGAVTFDDFGPDVAAWLRRIGFVLSTSDDESFHLAPAEGMASGAVPVVRAWPGAETIYDPRWVFETPAEMADFIDDVVRSGRWERERDEARAAVRRAFPLDAVSESFTRILVEDVSPDSVERALMGPA